MGICLEAEQQPGERVSTISQAVIDLGKVETGTDTETEEEGEGEYNNLYGKAEDMRGLEG